MLIGAVVLTSLTACREQFEDVDDVRFEASVEAVVCKVGQPVVFQFQGNPDIITFYSGEVGNDYAFKNEDRIVPTRMGYSFTANRKAGPNPGKLPFSYSIDFSGEYTAEAVQAATWIDISDRFDWIPENKANVEVYSGLADLSDIFLDEQTPVYFNYCYLCKAGMDVDSSDWLVYSPTFYGITETTESKLFDITNSGWTTVYNVPTWMNNDGSYDPKLNYTSANNGKRLRMICDNRKPDCDREMWFVSGPIYKMANINHGPDFGKPIKSVANAMMSSYSYAYSEPGEYTVTFVATNANVYDRKERVVELKVKIVNDEGTITPPAQDEWN